MRVVFKLRATSTWWMMSKPKFELYPWDVLTSSGLYKDRIDHPECTTEVRVNAADLAERVTKLLNHLGLTAQVSSGFRTTSANTSANGAKKSAHMLGMAVDLSDPRSAIGDAIMKDLGVLERFDLYMESLTHTRTKNAQWVHLQSRPTKNRIFIP